MRVAGSLALALVLALPGTGSARTKQDVEVGGELRAFAQTGMQGQEQVIPSARFQYGYFTNELSEERNQSFEFVVHARWDEQDDQRTHADIRELSWLYVGGDWELRVGARKVFWGVVESLHLEDIINQTDLVENIDGEDKLGQPMINLSLVRDYGIFDFFVMPYFRERTFPGEEGRLRTPYVVDTDDPIYASGAEEWHTDFAFRWVHTLGDVDIGLSHFSGTTREPLLTPRVRFSILGVPQTPAIVDPLASNAAVQAAFAPLLNPAVRIDEISLLPVYHTIDQTGLELQYIWEDWAFKLEAISRSGQGERFAAAVAGFEYTRVGIFDTRIDLGWVVEYLWDERQEDAPGFFEQDVLFGTRWAFNNTASTDMLLGMIWDPETEEKVFSVEANHRIASNWKLQVDGRWFSSGARAPRTDAATLAAVLANDPNKKMQFVEDDDFIQIELIRYF